MLFWKIDQMINLFATYALEILRKINFQNEATRTVSNLLTSQIIWLKVWERSVHSKKIDQILILFWMMKLMKEDRCRSTSSSHICLNCAFLLYELSTWEIFQSQRWLDINFSRHWTFFESNSSCKTKPYTSLFQAKTVLYRCLHWGIHRKREN